MTEPHPAGGSIDVVVDAQWATLGVPGTWMDGAERLAVATVARTPAPGDDAGVIAGHSDHLAVAAAAMVAHHAPMLTADHVDRFEASGLRREHYVEIVGLVSRVIAVDTFDRGVGRPRRELPQPTVGEPPRSTVPAAKRRAGWVPTVGAIGPPTALSSVPLEAAAQEELHTALYLSYSDMADLSVVRQLTRAQMELVAARTSSINDCFF